MPRSSGCSIGPCPGRCPPGRRWPGERGGGGGGPPSCSWPSSSPSSPSRPGPGVDRRTCSWSSMPAARGASRSPMPGSSCETSRRSTFSCSPGKGAGRQSRSARSERNCFAPSSRRSMVGGCRRRSTRSSIPPTFLGGSTSRTSSPRSWSATITCPRHLSPGSLCSMRPSWRGSRPISRSAATSIGGRSPTTASPVRHRASGRGMAGARRARCSRRGARVTFWLRCSASPTGKRTPSPRWSRRWHRRPRPTGPSRSARSTSPSTATSVRRRAATTSSRSSRSSPGTGFWGKGSKGRCR